MNNFFMHTYGSDNLTLMSYTKAILNHILSPLHVYCRLRDCKIDKIKAGKITKAYEVYIYNKMRR